MKRKDYFWISVALLCWGGSCLALWAGSPEPWYTLNFLIALVHVYNIHNLVEKRRHEQQRTTTD